MIYLDNAATSFPKPASVAHSVYRCMTTCGANPGRSSHKMAMNAMELVYGCREAICRIIGGTDPDRLIFTSNATEGLNLIVRGIISAGMHVVISPFEHNALLRPLYAAGAQISILPALADGRSDVAKIPSLLRPNTKLVALSHVSNITGVISDIALAAKLCRQHFVPLLCDCSQSAGIVRIDAAALEATIVFPGHKGLMGPQGTGCVYLAKNMAPTPLMTGGTGSMSESFLQPGFLPDRYESGTRNLAGIAGLSSACTFIEETGMDAILQHEQMLARALIARLSQLPEVRILYPNALLRTGVVSLSVRGMDCVQLGAMLDEAYFIATRSGLHCAPLAHQTCGTFETGTLRLSPGWFNSICDMEYAADAIDQIIKNCKQ